MWHGRAALTLGIVTLLVVANGAACTPAHPRGPQQVALSPLATPSPRVSGGASVAVPALGAYFGAYTAPGVDRRMAITELERLIGRRFAIDHVYYRWNEPFPTADDVWTAQQGRIPFLAWSSRFGRTGPSVRWADIAAGKYDGTIDERADALRRFGRPLFLTFQHEPGSLLGNGPNKAGTAVDYVRAWRHIVTRFRQRGTTNVSFVWTLTAFSMKNGANSPAASALYPGDDVIDWIAADGYNQFACAAFGNAPWRTFTDIFSGFYAWAAPHHKPLMVAEFGVQEDPTRPGRKGAWFRQVAQQLPSMPQIKAIVYFNAAPACPNWVTSSPAALDGFRALGQDSYLRVVHAG